MSNPVALPQPNPESLEDLAKRINLLHEGILGRGRTNLKDAIEIGGYLVQVRQQLDHGQWNPWIEKNCNFARTTAWHYCRVFEGKCLLSEHLTLNEAKLQLGLIKEVPAEDAPTETPASTANGGEAVHASNVVAAASAPQVPAASGLIPLLQRVHQLGGIGSEISAQLAGKDAASQQQIWERACVDQEIEVDSETEIDASLAKVVGAGVGKVLAPKTKKSGGKGDVTPSVQTQLNAIAFDGNQYRMTVSDSWQNEIAAEMADIKKFSKYLAAGLLIVRKETVA